MNFSIPLRGHDALFNAFGVACLSAALSLCAHAGASQEQQSSQTEQQSSPPEQTPQPAPPIPDPAGPKPRKIWTNDDMVSLRSPADNYQAEKEAQQAAAAEAAVKKSELAKQIKDAGLTIKMPPTPEETQALIKDKEEQIKDLRERLDRSNQDFSEAEGSKKAAIQLQIEALSTDLTKIQLEVKALRSHLEELAKAAPSESISTPVTPPSPQK